MTRLHRLHPPPLPPAAYPPAVRSSDHHLTDFRVRIAAGLYRIRIDIAGTVETWEMQTDGYDPHVDDADTPPPHEDAR